LRIQTPNPLLQHHHRHHRHQPEKAMILQKSRATVNRRQTPNANNAQEEQDPGTRVVKKPANAKNSIANVMSTLTMTTAQTADQ
jgi:hypothetical protein